jgi:DNA-binding response OmpR family regulator
MIETEAATILILEPDILVRHPLAEYLRECGYRVVEAASAAEARDVLEAPQTGIDVLFASVGGADDGVFALARRTRAERPAIGVVLAGAVEAATARAAELCEDGPALSTPYGHRLVRDRIRRLLAARTRGSS